MGSNTSHEFRLQIIRLTKEDVAANDPTFWKAMFLTALSSDESYTYLPPPEVRTLRYCKPYNLVVFVMKCIEQLDQFLKNRTQVLDFCSALNSLHFLNAIVPFVMESEIEAPKVNPKHPNWHVNLPESVFAKDFATHFFWNNKTCVGTAVDECPLVVDNISGTVGETLINLLMECAFVKGFTLGDCQPSSEGPTIQSNFDVEQSLLWVGGIFSGGMGRLTYTADMVKHRIDVMRCILGCLVGPVYTQDALSPNPFLALVHKHPKFHSFCCSLLNVICAHYSKGMMPYSSYWWAQMREYSLALALQLMNVLLEEVPSSSANKCTLWTWLESVLQSDESLNNLYNGLFRVIENPHFSAHTTIRNSQKRVNCYQEAIILFWKLLRIDKFRALASKNVEKLLLPLLYFMQEARADYGFFGVSQVVSYILLMLSTSEVFARSLNKPVKQKVTLQFIPPLKNPTYADILVLTVCAVLSPSSPRWMACFIEEYAALFCNIVGYVEQLKDLSCYEIHCMLDFASSQKFLQKSVQNQNACALLLEGTTNLFAYQKGAAKVLGESLAASDILPRLMKIVAGTAILTDSHSEEVIELHEEVKENFQVDMLCYFVGVKKVASQEGTEEMKAVGPSDEQGGLRAMQKPLAIRQFQITDATLRWVVAYMWGIIHKHNLCPPLFDFAQTTLFKLK